MNLTNLLKKSKTVEDEATPSAAPTILGDFAKKMEAKEVRFKGIPG